MKWCCRLLILFNFEPRKIIWISDLAIPQSLQRVQTNTKCLYSESSKHSFMLCLHVASCLVVHPDLTLTYCSDIALYLSTAGISTKQNVTRFQWHHPFAAFSADDKIFLHIFTHAPWLENLSPVFLGLWEPCLCSKSTQTGNREGSHL